MKPEFRFDTRDSIIARVLRAFYLTPRLRFSATCLSVFLITRRMNNYSSCSSTSTANKRVSFRDGDEQPS